MISRDIFMNLSPLDHRYSESEGEVFEELTHFISEDAAVHSYAKCEIALIKTHLKKRGKLTATVSETLDRVAKNISTEAVYEEEERTKHNIRALVNVLKESIVRAFGAEGNAIAPLVHLGATSVDILDTALSCRMRDATQFVILPQLKTLELGLCALAVREAETPQVGRTHGQHAVPITFGWSIAEFVARLGKSILRLDALSKSLVGKLSGPVGAYNGMSILTDDPEEMEKVYTAFLGLQPSEYSNQLVEPEPVLRLLLEMNVAFGILANLADDFRSLQRSEIGEVYEHFDAGQVGSSTMPQKRNPWNSEHVKSLWKAMFPRVITFYSDQISEHQRDLTNSASQRFIADYLAGFTFAVHRMSNIVRTIKADREAMARNLSAAGGKVLGGVLAEPAYLLLAKSGVNDAHEVIRKITLEAESSGKSFYETLKTHGETFSLIASELKKLSIEADDFFNNSAKYSGLAAEKSRRIADKYAQEMASIEGD